MGSITVAADNNEIYAVTANDVFQLIDQGDSGVISWGAELNGFYGYANVDVQSNGLTATVAAIGVVVMIGDGNKVFGRTIMLLTPAPSIRSLKRPPSIRMHAKSLF